MLFSNTFDIRKLTFDICNSGIIFLNGLIKPEKSRHGNSSKKHQPKARCHRINNRDDVCKRQAL